MAMNFRVIFENKEYVNNGYNGKCPDCGNNVFVEKLIDKKPTTPMTTCVIVVRCIKCKKILRKADATENILSQDMDWRRGKIK